MHALQVELDSSPTLSGEDWRHCLRKQTLILRASMGEEEVSNTSAAPLWLCALGTANFPDSRCGVANNTTRPDTLTTPNLFELSTRGTLKSFMEYWRSSRPFVQGPTATPLRRRAYKLHRSELLDHSPRYWPQRVDASPSRSQSPLGSPFGSLRWADAAIPDSSPPRNTSPPPPPPAHGVVPTPTSSVIEPDEVPGQRVEEEVDRESTPDPVPMPPMPTAHTAATQPVPEDIISPKDAGTPPLVPRLAPLAKPILRSSDSDVGTPRRGSGTPASVSFADAPPMSESPDNWPLLPFMDVPPPSPPKALSPKLDAKEKSSKKRTHSDSPLEELSHPPDADAPAIADKQEKKRDKLRADKTDKKAKAEKEDRRDKPEKSKRDKSDKASDISDKTAKSKKEKKKAPEEEGKKEKKAKSSTKLDS